MYEIAPDVDLMRKISGARSTLRPRRYTAVPLSTGLYRCRSASTIHNSSGQRPWGGSDAVARHHYIDRLLECMCRLAYTFT